MSGTSAVAIVLRSDRAFAGMLQERGEQTL